MSPSPVDVVTTTITSLSPSSSSFSTSPPSKNTQFPFASVIGGSLAGIVLAIIAAVGWHFWGKSIRKSQALRRKEAMLSDTTLENTRRNATIFSPRTLYSPVFTFPPERKVKFTFSIGSSIGSPGKHTNSIRLSAPSSDTVNSPLIRASPPAERIVAPLAVPALQIPAPLAHKASNASSLSMYSTKSGEPHQSRPPPSLISRKPDSKRTSNLTRSSRSLSLYSALDDIDELSSSSDTKARDKGYSV